MTTKMDIFSMLSHFRDGVSRPNKYRLELSLPRGVSAAQNEIGVNNDALQGRIASMQSYFNGSGGIAIKCHTMTFPQRSILTTEQRQNSAPFRTPYSATYDPVTFSFYANSYMDTRDYFEVWQSAVVNLGTNTMNFYSEYVADVKMFLLNDYGEDAYSVTLFEAWPMNIGIVDASYSQNNSLTTCTVTLSFKSWAPEFNSVSSPSA